MRAIHAQRGDVYPPGYWQSCLQFLHARGEESHTLIARGAQTGGVAPTLVVAASRDAICDPVSSASWWIYWVRSTVVF